MAPEPTGINSNHSSNNSNNINGIVETVTLGTSAAVQTRRFDRGRFVQLLPSG
eukprot:CAMPEP_0194392350 /NCGR_PEP_ID=MMETSP0174-20130528/121267_1 /TAXON_ID=216777 /ORGANISM="Proboscia alata, Strain PI-D3" /LENGTH=52 /DNA_ID=CAMNT_0039187645 /DNA_START=62 /DNA_END=216 /DNA_ORIENTATION=-